MQVNEQVTLDNLGHGAAAELFQNELGVVIRNIMDPNTKADAARSITLKMKIKPSEKRTVCAVEISCESRVAPTRPHESTMFVGLDGGAAVATEYDPQQLSIPYPEPQTERPEIKRLALNK
jgi:hypothetical protein